MTKTQIGNEGKLSYKSIFEWHTAWVFQNIKQLLFYLGFIRLIFSLFSVFHKNEQD